MLNGSAKVQDHQERGWHQRSFKEGMAEVAARLKIKPQKAL